MRRIIAGFLFFLLVSTSVWPSTSFAASPVKAPPIQWEKNSLGSEKQIKATAYNGKDLYVAVGDELVKTSKDGMHWEEHPLVVELTAKYLSEIHAVTYGKDAFIAVGSEGNILRSRDGVKWEWIDSGLGQATYAGDKSLYSIIWDGEQYITVGENGLVMTSKDGSKWTVISYDKITGQKPNDPVHFFNIKYLNHKYFILGGSIWTSGVIIESDNGKDWKVVAINNEDTMQSIAYNGSTFVASGGSGMMFYSADGSKWSQVKERLPILWGFDAVWNGKLFFLNAEGSLLRKENSALRTFTSADGKTWKELDQLKIQYTNGKNETYATVLTGLLYDGKKLLALNERNEVVTSTDLQQWSSADYNEQYQKVNASDIVFTGGKYFITPKSLSEGLQISEDGEHWTNIQKNLQKQVGNDRVSINKITWSGDRFIAVGNIWDVGWKEKSFISSDGYSWTMNPLTIEGLSQAEYEWLSITKIEVMGNKLVMLGNYYTVKDGDAYENVGLVATSDNGSVWSMPKRSFNSTYFSDLAYGNETYIIAGVKSEKTSFGSSMKGSQFYTSSDLENWNLTYSNNVGTFGKIHWNGRQFVASGLFNDKGTKTKFLLSTDAKKWKEYSFPFPDVPYPNQIVWTGSYYIGVCNYGKLIYSADGTKWTQINFMNYTENLLTVIWDGNKFITGGPDAVFYGTP